MPSSLLLTLLPAMLLLLESERRMPLSLLLLALLPVMMLLLESERRMPLSLLLLTLLPVIMLLLEKSRRMPHKLLLLAVLFKTLLSSVFQSSTPTLVLDKFKFITVILLQFTSITCPASSTL